MFGFIKPNKYFNVNKIVEQNGTSFPQKVDVMKIHELLEKATFCRLTSLLGSL